MGKEDGAFKQQIDGTIRTEDLVQALQLSKTFEYVTAVMEASTAAAEGQVELMKDGKLTENIPAMVKETMAKIREGKTLNIGPASQADMTKTYQNQTSVQGDPWLMKKREELIKLYQADAQVLRQYLGYYDRYTEERRAKLRNKLRDSWKDWKGMRRAFPSYMLVLAGKQGTGLFDVMSDLYSWTAVQQIETREMADNAGSECDLVLSNMRKRITGGSYRPTDLYGSPAFDTQMELKAGNHMYVGMGFGPDFAHMEKFAGRVTGVNHGPITQVQLKSYSTTLNNQPNSGRGFYVDGWDGQQSLAEAILYTISQTSGLEGLGRRAPGQATDRLGRSARGFAEEDYRSSMMVSLYRTFGSPGLAWMMDNEDTRRRAGTLLDIVARNGLDSVKDMILGDPQIYENVWVTNSPEASGAGEMFFGGLADYLTGGKGWGWAARPGRTAWSQLKEQALLFPEYVVATRPYNAHVPLSDIDTHPLRQTLYFGPKTGSYIHSSREPGSTDAFNQMEEEELEKLLREDGDSQYEKLWEEYKQIFVEQTAFKQILKILQGGEGGSALGDVFESLGQLVSSLTAGNPVYSDAEAGRIFGFLDQHTMDGDRLERTERLLDQLFPNTFRFLRDNLMVSDVGRPQNFPFSEGGKARDMTAADYLNVLSLKSAPPGGGSQEETLSPAWSPRVDGTQDYVDWEPTVRKMRDKGLIGDHESNFGATGQPEMSVLDIDAARRSILDAFKKDLIRLAKEPGYFESLGSGQLSDNPLIKRIRRKLINQGFVPSQRMKPIQRHHFGDTYRKVASQNIMASDSHPAFANRVTLSFPTEPDKRLAAYLGQQGEMQSYQVQASPTISEDFIIDDQVYFPNLRYNQGEVAGMIAEQLDASTPDGVSFSELIEERKDIKEALKNGEKKYTIDNSIWEADYDIEAAAGLGNESHPADALEAINQMIEDALGELRPFYTRPKFSTVAINVLKQRFKHMYTGDLIMMGDPSIRPYHAIHLWDDIDQMHGPVEVDGVYHRFDAQQGFYTQVKPKLMTYMRGADEGMDTKWMGMAGQVSNYMNWASRAGNFLGSMMGLGGRAVMYKEIGQFIANRAGSFLAASPGGAAGTVARGALGAASGLIWLDLIRTVGKYLYETGQDKAASYVGMISGAMDANPIMFLPLSYKGEPYTAGLTGSTGPASMTEVAASQLDEEGLLEGATVTQVANRIASLYDTSQQGPS
ncbi:hypothetical protein BSZ35_00210 [Salinibacter sp. 10B]|nr:hypothetical protein BSZ35_00210 [Salinibacter sp. 10B]